MLLSLFTITSENLASTTAYIKVIFDDVKLLFFLILGIGLALWVVDYLIKAFSKQNEK